MLYAKGFKPVPVQGKYKGVAEKSFMVQVDTSWKSRLLRTIAKTFNQESILHVVNGKSTLEFITSGERVEIGNMVRSDKASDYSIINGKKYTVK